MKKWLIHLANMLIQLTRCLKIVANAVYFGTDSNTPFLIQISIFNIEILKFESFFTHPAAKMHRYDLIAAILMSDNHLQTGTGTLAACKGQTERPFLVAHIRFFNLEH